MLAAKLADKIVSIEANPVTFDCLAKNMERNAVKNVRMVNKAVSDRVGSLAIYDPQQGNNHGAATTIEARGGAKIATVASAPLDEILTRDELTRIALIKIDVEGGELPIIQSILDRIHLYPEKFSIIVEAAPSEDTAWDKIFDHMTSLSFKPFLIPNEYTIDWYLNRKNLSGPSPLNKMPNEQSDILFERV